MVFSLSSLSPSLFILAVYKDRSHRTRSKRSSGDDAANSQSTFIPVVGEDEPELKKTGGTNAQKRKLDPSQLATDDFFYDKYRKRTRHY